MFLVQAIEQEEIAKINALHALVDAALLSAVVPHAKNAVNYPYDALQRYSEMTLPYLYKKDKLDTEDLEQYRSILAQLKESLKKSNEATNKEQSSK